MRKLLVWARGFSWILFSNLDFASTGCFFPTIYPEANKLKLPKRLVHNNTTGLNEHTYCTVNTAEVMCLAHPTQIPHDCFTLFLSDSSLLSSKKTTCSICCIRSASDLSCFSFDLANIASTIPTFTGLRLT